MASSPTQDAAAIRRGYEQNATPVIPAGMYVDHRSGLVLPDGVQPRGIGRVAAAYATAVLLFVLSLGVGYLIWSLLVWRDGQTPAQRLFGLRCWRPESRSPATRGQMALRQVIGVLVNGELLLGLVVLLSDMARASVGDYAVGTVVVYDPRGVLQRSP